MRLQTVVLITGSACLTFYGLAKLGGWGELRHWCGSDMFNLWKPLIPAGVQGTWLPVIESNSAGHVVKQAWYFNGNFPWLGMLFCAPIIGLWYWCTDQYIVQRALGAPNETVARRGSIFAAFLKLSPVYLFIVPGLICFALAKSGKIPELGAIIGPDGHAIPATAQGAFPLLVEYLLPPGLRGIVVAGLLVGIDGIPCRGVQRLFDVIYRRSLPEMAAGREPAPDCPNWTHRDHGDGAGGSGVDSRHQERAWPLRLSASRSRLPCASDFRGVLFRSVFQTAERRGCALGDAGRLRAGYLPHAGGYAGYVGPARVSKRISLRLVFLGRQQYLFPVFQCANYRSLGDRDGRGQLHDDGAGLSQDSQSHFRNHDRGG